VSTKKPNDPYAIQTLSSVKPISFVPSGIPELDELIGGFPRARLTELVGAEGIGKSTIVSKCAVAMSKKGRVLYIDAEQALNPTRLEELGADLKKIDYTALYELEAVAELITTQLAHYDAIIVDSIAVLVPRAILEGDIGDSNIALYARQMAKFIKRLKPALGKSNCALVCVNQWRQSPDMFKPRYIPGGSSYGYALDLRLELTSTPSKDKILVGTERVGHTVHITVTKSRVSAPHISTKFKLFYKELTE
jgi:recombination protein RecA